jgi:amino-acid N-acetyltransferase
LSEVTLRPATAEDETTIRRLIRGARLDPTNLHWQNFTCACDEAGRIVGIAQVKPYRDCREFGSLVVVPSWQGKGVAAALIRRLVEAERGVVWLVCRDRLAPLYARFGFVFAEFRSRPRTLKVKTGFATIARMFGIRIIAMRRG